ncbi:MAG: hypothetical protein KAI47_19545, partial [Deltaproteobacteria bacterium]|nr:hypothetical protein [Deltaproteobacteria bacterium]
FSPQTLRVALLVPHGALARGAKNRLVVLVSRVDGRPVQGAKVALRLGGHAYHVRTDDLGSAVVMTNALPKARSPSLPRPSAPKRVAYRPVSRGRGSCPPARRNDAVVINVTTRRGYTQEIRRCPPIIDGEPRLDVAHHLVLPDAAIDGTFAIPRAVDGSLAFCDLLKGGQSVVTVSAPVHHGIARFRIPAPPHVDGLVVLRAYRLGARDARQSDRRAIWIEPRARLKVQMRLDRAIYRPGAKAMLSVHVTRSDTGRGVPAVLGLRGVDRALLALMPKDGDAQPHLFMLASWAKTQTAALPARPENAGLGPWLSRRGQAYAKGSRDKAKRRRALDLLLSVLRPPTASVWETDPWKAREDHWETQRDAIVRAVKAGVKTLSLGQRRPHGWRFHRRCVHKLIQGMKLSQGSERDPWARVIWGLRLPALDDSLNFHDLAATAAQEKIDRVYGLLERFASKLPLTRIRGFDKDAWLAILPRDLFARLRRLAHVPAHLFVDPWGHRLRIRHYRHTLVTLGENSRLSRAEVVSMGPDERLGTPDDVIYDGVMRHPIGKKGLAALLCSLCHCSKTRCASTGCACSGGGYGRGGARLGGRRSSNVRVVVGRSSIRGGRRYRQPEAPRVRSRFPETLLWRPEVLTDRRGHAEVPIPLADNITTWKIFADASTKEGLFGAASVDLRVFQPFFVDVDLPRALTVGDHLALPVTVSNYTKRPLTATVNLAPAPWYRLAGPATRMLTVPPGAVAVTHAEITVLQEGRHALRLTAHGRDGSDQTHVSDAAERQTSVLPDGSLVGQTFSGVLATTLRQDVSLPLAMLPRSGRVELRFEAGSLSTTFEGLEGLLDRPHGCFEQTSATVIPNLLVLDYLRRTHLATRKIERRALAYLAD